MRWASRLFLVVLLALGAVRAWLFLDYAYQRIPAAFEAFHLESKMVHLAWRVQAGVRLYPDWRSYPHVANFFAPLYYVVVGRLGRALGSSLDELYIVGRLVTFGSVLATTLMLGLVVGRRHGAWAGVLGAVVSLGVGPLFGFGIMTRPDAMADLLGLAGFFLATSRRRGLPYPGGLLLVLAVLTKQTCGAYLLAAALSLWFEGRRGRAIGLLGACCAALALFVGGITRLVEPNFGPCLLAEGDTPWDLRTWRQTAWRITVLDPEWLVLAASGLALWNTGPRRDVPATVLTVVLLVVGYTTIAKRGSDLNYVLGLRAVGALAAGALWEASWARPTEADSARRSRFGLAVFTGLMTLGVVTSFTGPINLLASLLHAYSQAERSRIFRATMREPSGQRIIQFQRRLFRVAEDPSTPILTDSGLVDIRQRERTVFGDPWLFRMLSETGRLDLARMERWIDEQHYAWIATTKDLYSPSYESYDFGLPMPLVERARLRYQPAGHVGGFFLYVPRRAGDSPGREVVP
jgi:hypothetical protein